MQSVELKSRADLLLQLMRYKRLPTAYSIARAADLRTQSGRITDGRVQHLVSGRRKTCDLTTALAATEALSVPIGVLFRVDEYPVPRTATRAA